MDHILCFTRSIKFGLFILPILVGVVQQVQEVRSHFVFTNLICESHEPTYVVFPTCAIKSINRTYKYVELRAHLLKVPITNIMITMSVLKRFNGYKPFLYNVTAEGCSFLKNRKKYTIFNFLFEYFEKNSNFNHTCPYDHDILVHKLDIITLGNKVANVLPVPHGDYMLHIYFRLQDVPVCTVKSFFTIS